MKITVEEIANNMGITVAEVVPILHEFFSEQFDEYISNLKKSIDEINLIDIRSHAHKMKGAMRTLGLEKISDILQKIEDAARYNSNVDYNKLFLELKSELDELILF